MNSPILFNATTPAMTDNRQFGVTDEMSLKNPYKTATLIDEIRFLITDTNTKADQGNAIRANFRIGRVPLTSGFVPVSSLCKLLDVEAEIGNVYNAIGGNSPSYYTWRLPRPLYIPATEYLVPTFQMIPVTGSNSAFSGSSMTTKVGYAGRSLPQDYAAPATVQVPWAASFIGTPVNAVSTPLVTDQSTEIDLYNPFPTTLNIERLSVRFMFDGASDTTNVFNAGLSVFPMADMTLQIVDANGKTIVRDRTPIYDLCSVNTKTWDIHATMKPRGYYLLQFTTDASNLQNTGLGLVPFVSIVGWRDVALREVMHK